MFGVGFACFYRARLPVSSLSTVKGNPYASASTVETRNVVMANYMVRVELFKAGGEDYSELHQKMEALGLKRTVLFDDGKPHAMPTGTYFGSSNLDLEPLRNRITAISNPLSPLKDAAIFVCLAQSNHEQWSAFLYPV